MNQRTLPISLRTTQASSPPYSGRFPRHATPPRPHRSAGLHLDAWQRLADELRHPDLELDPETFAAVSAAFHRRRRAGVAVDPVFASLMTLLSRQMLLTYDDVDASRDLETIGGAA